MRIVLEVTSGSYQGRKLALTSGQTVKVGRTAWADVAFPNDNRMSSLHFSVQCAPTECTVHDLESRNGTFLNGEKILQSRVQHGDTVRAGRTEFAVNVDAGRATITQSMEGIKLPSKESLEAALVVTLPERPAPMPPALRSETVSGLPYPAALNDEEPSVRRAALLAAVWTSQDWVLEYCRGLADAPSTENWDGLRLLGVLGQPSDLDRILAIGRTEALGSKRFRIYSTFGHPGVVRDLLFAIEGKDPASAVSAGIAFTLITGAEIESEERVALAPEDGSQPDEFEKEFLDEAFLPSPPLANEYWNQHKQRYARGTRWRRGLDLSRGVDPEMLQQLDMQARSEVSLRERFAGSGQGCLLDLWSILDNGSNE